MTLPDATPVSIEVDEIQVVSGLFLCPAAASACYVMAHGAGAGMTHPFMAGVAGALSARGIATLRYQFPFAQRGSRRPDSPALAHATVRAAVAAAQRLASGAPLIAGGKSFGGRMTSQAQAASPLPGVRGLVFLGFPLHLAGRPSLERARHLADVALPILFLSGDRDPLADAGLLATLAAELGPRASLQLVPGADHAFHVPRKVGRGGEVWPELASLAAAWIRRLEGAERDPSDAPA